MIDILLNNVIPCSVNIIVIIYIISKLLNKSFNFNNPKNYIFVVLLIVVNVANFYILMIWLELLLVLFL